MEEKFIYSFLVLRGIIWGLVLLFVLLALLAVLSYLIDLELPTVTRVLVGIYFLMPVAVGYHIGGRIARQGWLNGALGGLVLSGILLLPGTVSVILTPGLVLVLLLMGFMTGGIGGIIGINF